MFKPTRLAAASAAACAALTAPAITAAPALADGAAPICVTFDKHYVGGGQFEGTTGGAAPAPSRPPAPSRRSTWSWSNSAATGRSPPGRAASTLR